MKLDSLFYWGSNESHFCLSPQIPCLGKCLETAVIRLFNIIGKTTCRQLFALEVILQAFTADALAAASRIAAITKIHIRVFFAVHHFVLSVQHCLNANAAKGSKRRK